MGGARNDSPGRARSTITISAADPGLAANGGEAAAAIAVAAIQLQPGSWQPPAVEPDPGHLGYLVGTGLLVRRVAVGDSRSVELLGGGDLIRPWQEDSPSFASVSWIVAEPTTIAILDRAASAAIGAEPQLLAALLDRSLRRARAFAFHAAAESMVGLEQRLLTLLWGLAERWGELRSDGVHIDLPLTQQTLADLVGARRPSVSTALAHLRATGALTREPGGSWLLGDRIEHSAP